MATWNSNLAKEVLQLSNAGEEMDNPILDGLPFQVKLRFNQTTHSVAGKAGITSPPVESFSFVLDPDDAMLYTANFIAGTAPFATGDAGVRNNIRVTSTSSLSNSETIWEKKLYIANLPTHAVQVYDRENGWTSVNSDTLAARPLCSQMCPIRFFSDWYDQFEIPGFGGAKYVSIFDQGTEESEETKNDVERVTDQDIELVHYIYLVKHALKSIETHNITIRFKTAKGLDVDYVDVNIEVQSPECYGFEIQDPIY